MSDGGTPERSGDGHEDGDGPAGDATNGHRGDGVDAGAAGPGDVDASDLPADSPAPPDRPDETGRDNVRSMGTQGEAQAREELASFDPDADGPTPDLGPDADPEGAPPPEYAIEGLSGMGAPPVEEQIEAYRRQYGFVRTFFRVRSDRYRDLQRSLNQARIGESYDTYLARAATYALVAAVVGVVLGALLTLGLARVGAFDAIRAPAALRGGGSAFVFENRVLFGGIAVSILTALVLGGATYLVAVYYPSAAVSTRRQSIDVTLPHAIVYMYALSYGGMNLSELVRSLADAEDTYGEVAREFDTVVRDLELFGNDLFTALQNLRNTTPSDNLEQFLDDLLSVLDSGGEVTGFLEDEARGYLEEAGDAQEDFLETLAILSEVFIVGFVATPLFLVVILVVISLVGGQTIAQLTLLVYAVIPIGMVMFLVLVDTLSEPYVQRGRVAAPDRTVPEEEHGSPAPDDERLAAYRSQRRRDDLRGLVTDPVTLFRDEPRYTLALTVPLALGTVAGLLATGTVGLRPEAFVAAPIANTTWLVVVPLLTVMVPLSVGHEYRAARERRLTRRFPNTLSILASANKMGIGLTEGIGLVVRSSSGTIAEELRKVRNDILWNASTSEALLAFGARLHVPQLARTSRLLAEGIRSTGDLSRVLSIAAEDARNRYKLDRARTREMTSYVAIVVIGYLVYLLVVLLLDANYLGPIAETADPPTTGLGGAQPPLSFTSVPVDVYEAVFFHSALIQGVGSGLLAGKLSDNTVLSGLKFSIGLVTIALVAFTFV
ncbi:type II secretion system F family protein [Salinirubellus salinus]|uniref:Type II secretion system F family protein n=1 Tax=Salinirubellus salinus TaxID=1364945 RepID=A0A9E7R5V3_9EURY|nr:type II secretion system F family protein [Salinirubellus salinus]UWM56465.1 type II secretion system F family protein [Salinirubellus salinus]